MKRKNLFLTLPVFILSALAQLATVEAAEEVAATKTDSQLMNKAHAMQGATTQHSAGGHASPKKDKPFWSKDQTRQAELEKKYKEEIAKHPGNKKNYAYLAGLYLTNNKTTKAIDAYQDAITHDSTNPKLFTALSIAYLHQSKFNMANAMANEALRLDPSLKQVEKINAYIIAKKTAIEAASKVPAGGEKTDMTRSDISAMHGNVMPTASGVKPSDKIHTPQ